MMLPNGSITPYMSVMPPIATSAATPAEQASVPCDASLSGGRLRLVFRNIVSLVEPPRPQQRMSRALLHRFGRQVVNNPAGLALPIPYRADA